MGKHNHRWHFIKEVYVDELYKLLWPVAKPEKGNYAKFVCEECGSTKMVLMSGQI